METEKDSEFGWRVSAEIHLYEIQGAKINRREVELAIWRALKAKPWMIRGRNESKPAHVALLKTYSGDESIYTLDVQRNLKSTQLHAFHLFLRDLVRELISSKIPNLWFINAGVRLQGKSITLACPK